MTTTLSRNEDSTTTRIHQTPGLLATLFGHQSWFLWLPLLLYVTFAMGSWGWLALIRPFFTGNDDVTWTTLPATTLFLGSLVAIGLMWTIGVRHALALGYDRKLVFWLMTALSFAIPAAYLAISLLANQVEHAVMGTESLRVLALSDPTDKFGTNDGLLSPVWTLGVLYVVPLVALFVASTVAGLRWGVLGGITSWTASMFAVFTLVMAYGAAMFALYGDQSYTGADATATILAVLLWLVVVVGSLVIAHQLFRKVRT